VRGWGLRDVLHADLVLTLSFAVAGRFEATGRVPRDRLFTLFHPDLTYGPPADPLPPSHGAPFRFLFLGRILPYKGLAVLLDALDILKEQGLRVELGVFGEGPLGPSAKRLEAMGA
jgi:glycosyltransferase involved in cell wall biosynthesis